jgi:hypothetical protein
MQAELLHEALGGGHSWRHMKNAAAAAAAKKVVSFTMWERKEDSQSAVGSHGDSLQRLHES